MNRQQRKRKVRSTSAAARAALRNEKCFAIGRLRDCYGGITLHHIVARQRLKRDLDGDALALAMWDPRNLIAVCFGCHQLVETASIHVESADLPAGFWNFIEEYGLHGSVPRHLFGYTPETSLGSA